MVFLFVAAAKCTLMVGKLRAAYNDLQFIKYVFFFKAQAQ